MSEGRRGALVAGLLVVVAAVVLTTAWATRERPFTASIPQPPPLEATAIVPVPPGEEVCLLDATVLPRSEVAQFRVGTRGRPPVPLTFTVRAGDGYRSSSPIPATWKDNDLLAARVSPPPSPVFARACLRNRGRRTIDVYASDDRSKTLLATYVGEERVKPNIQLSFVEAEPASIASRTSRVVRGLDAFRPGVVGPWLLWPLFALVALGLPLGLTWAMWCTTREP